MSRTVYVNGEFLPEEDATVSIFDRGFLFADAVYEVVSVLDRRLVDYDGHARRLERSLAELDMSSPVPMEVILDLHRKIIALNELDEGLVYLQITRGAADRNFEFPDVEPTMIMFTQDKELMSSPAAAKGISVISLPDLRWGRRDIKTVQLVYPSMCKMAAREAGVDDAWLTEDGVVTEGTSNNAHIVTADGTLVTRALSSEILHGVTRAAILRLAREAQISVEERPFTVEEAQGAAEAFITSATNVATPVVSIDGKPVGNGEPGPVAARLREIYLDEAHRHAI